MFVLHAAWFVSVQYTSRWSSVTRSLNTAPADAVIVSPVCKLLCVRRIISAALITFVPAVVVRSESLHLPASVATRKPCARGFSGQCPASADHGTCPRCLAWEKEGIPSKGACNFRSGRTSGGTKTTLLFKREPARMQILSKYSSAALRAGALPALLPFHSRLFRRAHHTTKQARRWVVQNLSKAAIKANHPRCDLCSPCSPCLLPYWGYHHATRATLSMLRLEAARRHQEDAENCCKLDKPCDQVLQAACPVVTCCHGTDVAVDSRASGQQNAEEMENERSNAKSHGQISLFSSQAGEQQPEKCSTACDNPALPRPRTHLSRSLMVGDSCESWHMVQTEEDPPLITDAGQVRMSISALLDIRGCHAVGFCCLDRGCCQAI